MSTRVAPDAPQEPKTGLRREISFRRKGKAGSSDRADSAEQNRAGQNRADQNRAEQNGVRLKRRAEQNTALSNVGDRLMVGAEPRVNLLPPEVRAHTRARHARRGIVVAVITVLAVVAAGGVGSSVLAASAQQQLAAAQAQTQSLLLLQGKYSAVRTVQSNIDLVKAAQQVGASTEINWKDYLQKIQSVLPAGVVITAINAQSGTPQKAFEQATTPLTGVRVATVTLTVSSQSLEAIPALLDALGTLPGYVAAMPGAITQSGASDQKAAVAAEGATWSTTIALDVDQHAYTHRFAADEKK